MATTPETTDPGAFAHTAEGVDRSEELAEHVIEHMVSMTGVAQLDTTITSMFLLAEILAALDFYAGLTADEAVGSVRHLTAERVAALQAAPAAEAAPVPEPARSPAAASRPVLH